MQSDNVNLQYYTLNEQNVNTNSVVSAFFQLRTFETSNVFSLF
jgi:hypothetical protein